MEHQSNSCSKKIDPSPDTTPTPMLMSGKRNRPAHPIGPRREATLINRKNLYSCICPRTTRDLLIKNYKQKLKC